MKKWPLLVLFITIFIDLLGFGLVIPILPIYAESLGAAGFVIGLIAGSFSLMQFLFSPFWGGLSDRYGRKPIILSSVFVNIFAYILFAYSSSLWLLLAARILAGIGSANISAAQAYISDVTAPENRAKAYGIMGAAFGLGFIFGPPLGGYLKANMGIEAVGWVAAMFCMLNFVVALLFLPESIKEKNKNSAIFVSPFSDLGKLWKLSIIRDLILMNMVFITAFSMMHVTSALLWDAQYGYDEEAIGYIFMYIGLISAIIQGGFIGIFNKYLGEKIMLILGSILMVIGLSSLPFIPAPHFMPLAYISLLILVIGNAMVTPTTTSLLSKNCSANEQGKILGINQSFGSLARFVGPIVGTTLYGLAFHSPFWVGGLLMILVLLMAVRFIRISTKAAT